MQKTVFIIFIAGLCLLGACKKDEVNAPAFEVSVPKTTYRAGDTVTFSFSGNPDIITFFSGQEGFRYEHVNRTSADGTPVLSFETSSQNGAQLNSLRLMVSRNFNGVYNAQGVSAASWTDISDRAVWSQGNANVKSGNIDLSDFADGGNVYLAFKFTGQQEAGPQRQWTVKSFVLNNVLTDGSIVPLFANISAPGWLAVDVKNPDRKWATPSATQLFIDGGPANTPENEDWIITSSVNLKAVKPDVGVPVKDITVRLSSYSYVYKTPGAYTVTFVGANSNIYGSREVVRQLQLTIE